MNIGLTGATGFVGSKLLDLALRRGHQIVAFTRNPQRQIPGCDMRAFTLDSPPDISGCDAIVHLAGESVMGLWTAEKKRRIRDSRVLGTRRVVEAINASATPPEVFVCGSGIGIYREGTEDELTETSPHGSNFLADTCKAWEAEAKQAKASRVVHLRIGLVLGKGGGALKVMAPLFKLGLGGIAGSGQQWASWIHEDDLAMLILFAIENQDVTGPLNAVAPWPVRNRELTATLASTLHRPAWFRAPAWTLRLALNDFSRELLDSKRVVPAAAATHGFHFKYPELAPALKSLLG